MAKNKLGYVGCFILGKNGQVYEVIRKTYHGYHVKQHSGPLTTVWQRDLNHSKIRHLGTILRDKDAEILKILYG